MNNPSSKPSSFADPSAHQAMRELSEAEYKAIEDKVKVLADEVHDFFLHRSKTLNLRPQHAVVALVELAGRNMVIASAMSPAFEHNLRGYLEFFNDVVSSSKNALNDSPLGQIILELFGGRKCSNELSSPEASPSSSSISAASPPSSSGESNDG